MSMSDSDLKKRLLNAFRGESVERMRVLSSDFLKLEKGASGPEASLLIESSYRELHSLKGAARAVGLGAVEKYCQSFESFFAGLKKKNLIPPRSVCSSMLNWLDILHSLMEREDESESSLSSPSIAVALSQMKEITESGEISFLEGSSDSDATSVADSTDATDKSVTSSAAQQELPHQQEEGDSSREAGGAPAAKPDSGEKECGEKEGGQADSSPGVRASLDGSVRISASFITGLLLRTEELISSRNSQRARAREVRDLEELLASCRGLFQNLHEEKRISAGEDELSRFAEMQRKLDLLSRKFSSLTTDVRKDSWELSSKVDSLLGDFKHSMLLPFSSMLDMFPHMVRSLSAEQGKKCEIEVSGEEVRIDRRILDMLHDPLIHMVRNSIDHGIETPEERSAAGKSETGRISFSITQTDRDVVKIIYSDDGRGINSDKVKAGAVKQGLISAEEAEKIDRRSILELVFISGMSTSEIITDISGRGLGMAIVRDKIESLGGSVVVASPEGRGIRIVMSIPVALTSFRGIVVESAGRCFVVPKSSVRKVLLIRQDDIGSVAGRESILFAGRRVPLISLADILELDSPEVEVKSFPVFIMGKGRRTVAVSIGELHGEQDVMSKSMGPMLKRVRNVSGISMLGSGGLAPILHGPDMIRTALNINSGGRSGSFSHQIGVREKKTVLVAEDSITSRMLLKNVLEAAGYNVVTAVDGRDALSRIKSELPDLLVSDVEMPHMDGFTLTASVRKLQHGSNLPIILVTSLGSQDDRERGVEAGADAYIIKSSFDQTSLINVIERLIA